MGLNFRTIISVILVPFVVVLYVNIEALAILHGWDGLLIQAWPSLGNLATQPWVFALAAMMIGLAAGAWINQFSGPKGGRLPKSGTSRLWFTIARSKESLETFINISHRDTMAQEYFDPTIDPERLARVRSALVSVREWGLPAPKADRANVRNAEMIRDYFLTIMPFVLAGQKKEAKQEARRFLKAHTTSADGSQT